jgi:hypothetical protein
MSATRGAIKLLDEGDYRAALIEFRKAYELAPKYQVLFNIGQIQQQLHDYVQASRSFERYLAEGGAAIPQARRDELRKQVDELKHRIATLNLTSNVPGVDVLIDDEPVGATPFAAPCS